MRSQRNHGLSEADFSCKPLLKSTPCEASPSSSTDRGKPTPGYQTVCTEYRARATLQLSFSITGTLCHSRAYQQLRGWRSYLWKVLLQWCTPQPWLRGTRKSEAMHYPAQQASCILTVHSLALPSQSRPQCAKGDVWSTASLPQAAREAGITCQPRLPWRPAANLCHNY